MKLQEKHIDFLDKLPLGEWVYNFYGKFEKGITISTLKALTEMGILEAVSLEITETIKDEDIKNGYIKTPLSSPPRKEWWHHRIFFKKIVDDYRTRDYEIETLKKELIKLQEKINIMTAEVKDENG